MFLLLSPSPCVIPHPGFPPLPTLLFFSVDVITFLPFLYRSAAREHVSLSAEERRGAEGRKKSEMRK